MKICTPYDIEDLNIRRDDSVLEVGPGHNPRFRSNVLVEKFIDTNYHRNNDVSKYSHQKLVCADGENLPFADNSFDYVICAQVLEHAEDPAKFISELSRVAKRGYLETPSFIGEFLFPKESHKWAIMEIDKKIVLYDKALIDSTFKPDFGNLFLDYLPYNSLAFRVITYLFPQLWLVKCEWEGDIEFLVNPQDEYYKSFFTERWTVEMTRKIFPKRGLLSELGQVCKALAFIGFRSVVHKINSRRHKLIRGAKVDEFLS